MNINGKWVESTPKIPIKAPLYCLTPSRHPKIHPEHPHITTDNTLSISKGSPRHSQTSLAWSGNLQGPFIVPQRKNILHFSEWPRMGLHFWVVKSLPQLNNLFPNTQVGQWPLSFSILSIITYFPVLLCLLSWGIYECCSGRTIHRRRGKVSILTALRCWCWALHIFYLRWKRSSSHLAPPPSPPPQMPSVNGRFGYEASTRQPLQWQTWWPWYALRLAGGANRQAQCLSTLSTAQQQLRWLHP